MAASVLVVVALVGSNHGRGAILQVGVATVAGVTVYLVAARTFGVGEVQALLSVRRRT
jgi:hypothetical protein